MVCSLGPVIRVFWVIRARLRRVVAELVEASLPRRALGGDPVLGRAQRLEVYAAGANPADLLGPDEAGRLKHTEVLHHRRQRHRQRLRKITNRGWTADQTLDQVSPRWIGEGLEHLVKRPRIVRHVLKY